MCAGGGDERTLLGMLSLVERRVAKLRQAADADADTAGTALLAAQVSESMHVEADAYGGGDGDGDGSAGMPDVQALADAASQLHQVHQLPLQYMLRNVLCFLIHATLATAYPTSPQL